MYITDHQYIVKYPINPRATRLILGTIHPHEHEKFKLKYFYGNELSLWKIFNAAFPAELSDPNCLKDVLGFLEKKGLTLSDTIVSCKRISLTALDKDLEIIKDNKEVLLSALCNSAIIEVLCTSGFGKNNAFKIFYNQILGLPLTKDIRKTRMAVVKLPGSNKTITVKALYSPARTANRGIAGSEGYKNVKHLTTVDEYRILQYRDAVNR